MTSTHCCNLHGGLNRHVCVWFLFLGASPSTAGSEEAKEKSDAMPNISDVMLRKLKLHRGLPGWCVTKAGAHTDSNHSCIFITSKRNNSPFFSVSSAPPLTEKEVEVGTRARA